jgi:hypothetical protein
MPIQSLTVIGPKDGGELHHRTVISHENVHRRPGKEILGGAGRVKPRVIHTVGRAYGTCMRECSVHLKYEMVAGPNSR